MTTSPHHGPRLERVAITVPDLEVWIRLLEILLGPGFQRYETLQSSGLTHIAIHPAGVELVQGAVEHPVLRSFHLATTDVDGLRGRARTLGWSTPDTITLNGRRHEVVDAEGLRLLLVEATSSQEPEQ